MMNKCILWFLILFCPIVSNATHIVGGELTYVYNGGSSYTVKLKLYRDCGPNTAGFPGNVSISVRGNNGATFSPSKDFTMNLASVVAIPSNQLPCSIPPNPMPCVEAGTYTKTVSNLPPNIGGYHLYYQIVARNLSLTNINGACNCIGESFYAYIPNNTVPANSNSNAVFTLFPPKFLCVNQPFTFNHGATDANGDSLVYSLYTPFNGDNGAGPLDPTFPSNTASFTPVVYLPGYTTNNPLGPSPFSINSVTGLITGTPGIIGQFVVGVRVKEYRNGIYISQTLRDFQFNVVNCPTPPPTLAVPNATINNGCSKVINAGGISAASANWTSIFPGPSGTYNNYLSCLTGCLNTTITAVGSPPPFVDFKVCGTSTNCAATNICDTFRVYFNPTLSVSIVPNNPVLCFGQTSTTLTAIPSGGTPPYSYLWNNSNTTQTISVGVGTYNIQLSDASGCPPVFNSVSVTSYSSPITANAGTNQFVCNQNPIAVLNGTVTGANGGVWSGGSGVYSPTNTVLNNLNYTPSAAELALGASTLFLTTTGNGNCPPKTTSVVINYIGFTGTVAAISSPVSCYGSTNGSATVSVLGGNAPHTFIWNTIPVQTNSAISNLAIGVYTVNITNGIGCLSQATVSIIQPPPININSTVTNITCNTGNNGSIAISSIGGTPPYSYLWLPGLQTTSSISNLSSGNYTVNVTDSKGCVKSSTYTLTQPLPLSITVTNTNVSCFGGSNGAINTTVTGGTSPYTYSWSPNGATSQNVAGLPAGFYTVVVTDLNSCTLSAIANVVQPVSFTINVASLNETCDYLNNGSSTVAVSGGSPAYTYFWQPGAQTTSVVTNLSSGNYTVNVMDINGCSINTVITISQPPSLSVAFSNQTNISCFGANNATAMANASGGTPIYSYTWMPSLIVNPTATNLSIGVHTVIVTDSKSCTVSNTLNITQPLPITVNSTVTNVLCNGGSNGSISLAANGGTSPFSIFWQPNGQSTFSISNLSAGTYTALITDANGCVNTTTYAVGQPLPISIAFTSTNITCNGGSNGMINSSVSGGTSPYTFSWTPNSSISQNVSGLSAGIYTLTVSDINNCIMSSTIGLIQPTAINLATNVTNETCDYLNNGIATTTVSGGSPGYTYLWQPGSVTSNSLTNLGSGNYTVTITDLNGCSINSVVVISQPLPLAVSFNNQLNVSCFGGSNGSATAIGSGGTPNYSYTWTPLAQTTAMANNLLAGTYSVTVSDANSCIATNTVLITQPPALNVNISYTNIICSAGSNGAIFVSPNGGNGPYTHTLTPGNITGLNFTNLPSGTYTILTQDANGCLETTTVSLTQPTNFSSITSFTNSNCLMQNGIASVSVTTGGAPPFTYSWSPSGGTNSVTTSLFAGSYTVQVTDNNGCVSSNIVNISDVSGPVVSIVSTTNVSCFGGSNASAVASFTGGSGPGFTYSWSPTGGNALTATNLASGVYVFKVVDNVGCIGLATTPLLTQPPALSLNYSVTPVSCFGGSNGSATVNTNGGTPAYSYTWLPGPGNGQSISGLSAGNYTIQVIDSKNCIQTTSLMITQPVAPLNIVTNTQSITCFGGTNGSASSTVTGGTAPYSYLWLPGNISGQSISNLTTGSYTVNVNDQKGCAIVNILNVIQPSSISITPNSISSNCSFANGQASVSVNGGIGPYSYTWSPTGGNTNIANSLASGVYTVIVKDLNNCLSVATQTVSNNPAPSAAIATINNVSCFGGSNATASVNVIGGVGPFTYSWLPSGGSNPLATNLSSGIYTVNVVSSNGCTVSAISPFISQPTQILINTYTTQISCLGGSNGSASVAVGGGTPVYSYTWMPSITNGTTVSNLAVGVHSISVSDSQNCIQTATFSIGQPSLALSITGSTLSNVSCFGANNGSVSLLVTGGTPNYSYSWNPSVSNSSIATGLSPLNYSINITDSKGCLVSTTVAITEPLASVSATVNNTSTKCFNSSTGSATVIAGGGTPSYSYLWSPTGGTNQTATNLPAGNYFVTVTDNNGCQTIKAMSISQPPALTGSVVVTDPACGAANGSILSQVSGGTGPYTYTWSPMMVNTSGVSNLLPGSYSVLISDNNGCLIFIPSNLINVPGPTVNLVSTNSVLCFGGSNGSASVNISQGTPPYVINWMPFGGNSSASSSLVAGTYSANVVDARGCQSSVMTTISEPNLLTLAVNSLTNVSCFGGNDGSVSVSSSGGNPSYIYTWLPSGSGSSISNLSMGSYTVSIKDVNNCINSIPVFITQPTVLTSTVSSIQNALCFNSSGNATVLVSGGTMPYNYQWSISPTQNGNVLTNATAGNYSVLITDANGCTNSKSLSITQPSLIITSKGVNDTICSGQQGFLAANAQGGVGNFLYSWQPINIINSGTLIANPTINTIYTVSAFDQNGCSGVNSTVAIVVYDFSASNLTVTGISPICPGQSSQLLANINGNTGPITFLWNQNIGTGPGIHVVLPEEPTTYIVNVINSCGSTLIDSVKVSFNPQPTINLSADTMKTCIPGSIKFTDSSVTGNVNDPITTWWWSFGDGSTSNQQNPSHTYPTVGTYTVNLTVLTDGGCTNTSLNSPVVINVYPNPIAMFSANSTELDLPYELLKLKNSSYNAVSYLWNFGDGNSSSEINPNYLFNSVGDHKVELIATSKHGCKDTSDILITTKADVIFPNAFTPNSDGPSGGYYSFGNLSNDIFFPYSSGVVEYKLQIFNRWGELIFETTDIKKGWDGYYRDQLCQTGVYVWKAYVKLNNGRVFDKAGDVTLLR